MPTSEQMNPDKPESGNATDSEFSQNSDTLSVTSSSSSSSSSSASEIKRPDPEPQQDAAASSPNYMKNTTSSVAKKTRDSQKGLARLPSSKFRMRRSFRRKIVSQQVSDDSSSSYDSEGRSVDNHTTVKSESTRSVVRRTSNQRPGRSLARVTSLRIRRQSGGTSVVRSTCSSALRDSKQHVESNNSNEKKVCPYSYCSLHGHHHSNDQVPTLKRFVSMRRRLLKPQKSANSAGVVSSYGHGTKRSSKKKRQGNQTKGEAVVYEDMESAANGGRQEPCDDISNVFGDKDSVISTSADHKPDGGGFVSSLSSKKSMERKNKGLWGLIYKHMASGIAEDGGESKTVEEKIEKDSVEGDGEESRNLDSHRLDAIKLVQEAFDKILSEIPDPGSDNQSVGYSDVGSEDLNTSAPTPDVVSGKGIKVETSNDGQGEKAESKRRINGWSNLKKIMIMKRFVKAMENVKTIDLSKPRDHHQSIDQEEGGEKINLRPQTIGEKKSSEEWMLDYALQKVISTLAPAQKRKVALIVQAFETVAPQGESGNQANPSEASSTPTSPVPESIEPEENIRFGILLRKVSTASKGSRDADGPEVRAVKFGGLNAAAKVRDDDSGILLRKVSAASKESSRNVDGPEVRAVKFGGLNAAAPKVRDDDSGILLRKVSTASKESSRDVDDGPEVPTIKFGGLNAAPKVRDDDSGSITREMKLGDQTAIAQLEEPFEAEINDNDTLATETEETTEKAEVDGGEIATEPKAQMGKQKNMNLWFLIYKHMVSGTTQPLQEDGEGGENGGRTDSQSQIEAIRLVEEAIDEIPLPDTQDYHPSPTRDINPHQEEQVEDKHVDERSVHQETNSSRKETTMKPADQETPQITNPPSGKKSWSNLKKVILLKRFIKSLEKVNDSCLSTPTSRKFINPKEPKFLPSNGGEEAEEVRLRRQDIGDRKSGDEWMLDHALRQVVAQLTPVRRRKVELLVEAFETVIPTIGS